VLLTKCLPHLLPEVAAKCLWILSSGLVHVPAASDQQLLDAVEQLLVEQGKPWLTECVASGSLPQLMVSLARLGSVDGEVWREMSELACTVPGIIPPLLS
jgi:hypothetical protein